MRSILLALLTLSTTPLFAQFQYKINLAASEAANKRHLSNIENHIPDTYNRFVGENTILFAAPVNYSIEYIDSILDLIGISGSTIKTKGPLQINEKAGGNNCELAEQLCSNASLPGNSSGDGTEELDEDNRGCLEGNEHQSSWYYINVQTAGTLHMRINPSGSDDYDFAVWGPFTASNAAANCPPVSAPTRCSWADAGGNYNTGMGNGATDHSEDDYGNRWVAPLNVSAGQVYILLVDNYSSSSNGYNINFSWNGQNTSTATLGCTPVVLPVEMSAFTGRNSAAVNQIRWTTETEKDNDYFQVEWTIDPDTGLWERIDQVDGAGDSEAHLDYGLNHYNYARNTINYYRIKQVDKNGQTRIYPGLVSIDNRMKAEKLVKVVNLLGQEVSETEKGLVIFVYDDGTTEKRVN